MNTSPVIDDMHAMVRRYKKFADSWTTVRFDQFVNSYRHIRAAWLSIRRISEELNRYKAAQFNVFEILGVQYDEVRTHSALIADLLNPEGTHAQKYLFLEAFLSLCRHQYPSFPWPGDDFNRYPWIISKEKATSFGRIDLVIACPELKYIVIIENKVGALEQVDQLKRYSEWLRAQEKFFDKSALIYLTPSGAKSSTAGRFEYFRLSYNNDIRNWLSGALAKVCPAHVRETILQYIQAIAKI